MIQFLVTAIRITSACAEQTRTLDMEYNPLEDHLRVCGADRFMLPELYPVMGSPPRVRSRRGGASQRES